MENIRRKLKIFWVEHSDPIKFYIIVIFSIIVIVQILNQLAIRIYNSGNNQNIVHNQERTKYKEDNSSTTLVNNFISFCSQAKIEEAYNLLSENCKKELYPKIEDFKNKYYNKIFSKKRNIQIKYDTTKDIYTVTFYEDILESGKVENRNKIEDSYKIEEDIFENKTVYINSNHEIK